MKILVLGGGDSPEREVSLRSAKAVANAAKEAGLDVSEADPNDGLDILDGLQKTIIFPILHGKGGEDGLIQAELEKRDLPYLGSDSKSSANCFNKWKTHQVLEANNIPMAIAFKVDANSYKKASLSTKPHVLKVLHGGSSIGTLIARDPSAIEARQVEEIFRMEDRAVLEELVAGIEVTVPILDREALPAIEIRPPQGGEFDYENKYNGRSAELCPPPSLTEKQHNEAKKLAEDVHIAMGCRHLSRVDTIMKPDGSFVVLEINTIPGLTDQSLYPKSAAVAGISMPELVHLFVDLVKRDFKVE